ncbi:MAG: PspC domain-containing protein [Bacteroidales bacterium]|nr:PspC domain-containing protein [Bacteroidales bacterium]
MQISLGGMYFHIDEDAYNLLQEYTTSLREYFSREGESSKEIIEDIEQRMAELLNARISEKKQVINLDDVNDAIRTLGKVEDFEFEKPAEESETGEKDQAFNRKINRRLYRDPDNSVLGGVCSGLAAYFNVDPWVVRIIFIIMLFINVIIPPFISLFGFGVLLYIILWIVVPKARTTAQKLQMRGEPVTVQNIKRSINDEYQKVKSGIEGFSKSEEYRKTRDAIQEILHVIGKIFVVFLKIIVYLIGFAFLVVGILLLAGAGTAIFTRFHWWGHVNWPHIYFPDLSDFFVNPATASIVAICLMILIAIPVISLIVWGFKLLLNVRGSNKVLQALGVTIWVIALIVLIALVFTEGETFAFKASGTDTEVINASGSSTLYLQLKDKKDYTEGVTVYSIFDYDIYYDRSNDKILGEPRLKIEESDNDRIELFIKKSMRNIGMKDAERNLEEIEYELELKDSVLIFNRFFSMDDDYRWRFPEVELILKVPENQRIYVLKGMEEILGDIWIENSYSKWELPGHTWIMSDDILKRYDKNSE